MEIFSIVTLFHLTAHLPQRPPTSQRQGRARRREPPRVRPRPLPRGHPDNGTATEVKITAIIPPRLAVTTFGTLTWNDRGRPEGQTEVSNEVEIFARAQFPVLLLEKIDEFIWKMTFDL